MLRNSKTIKIKPAFHLLSYRFTCTFLFFPLANLGLESGVYFIHLSAPGLCECRKIVFAP